MLYVVFLHIPGLIASSPCMVQVPSSVHWYGVENTNIQTVLFTFPGRGEVRALHRILDRVGRAGTRPGMCSVTPRKRGSLLLLLNKLFS